MTVVSLPIERVSYSKADADGYEGVDELAADIQQNGLQSPILVDEEHNLIAGLRRLLACIKLKHTHINAKVMTAADAQEAVMMVTQPILRRPCTREDLALLAVRLRNNGLTVYDIARTMDCHVSTVYRYFAHAATLMAQLEAEHANAN